MIINLRDDPMQWALLAEDGRSLMEFDAILSFEASAENRVSQEPVEKGSFATYNRAASPTRLNVRLARSGTGYDQQTMLDTLERLCNGTELVTLTTPAQEYAGYALEGYRHSHSDTDGAQLLVVDLSLVEVRQVETLAYTSVRIKPQQAKRASDVSVQDTGKGQTKKMDVLLKQKNTNSEEVVGGD